MTESKRGPKPGTKRRAEQITITLPAKIHDRILELMQKCDTDNRSGIIQELILLGLERVDITDL